MHPIVAAFSLLSIVILLACHFSRTSLTPSADDVLDPSSHDKFVADARALITSISPQKSRDGWKNLVKWAEKCTDVFLPRRDVDFAAFIQSVSLCTILAGFYNVDPDILSPLDVAFMTNALNCHSDSAEGSSNVGELSAMTGCIYRWVKEEHASHALEIVLPAYQSTWHLAAATLAYVKNDEDKRNAFLDFSENPTERQFRAFKVKDAKPSVEAIMKEVLRLHQPGLCRIMRKSSHPLWKRLLHPKVEMAGAQLDTEFDAMRFHPKQRKDHIALSFGYDELCWILEEWSLVATALIVAKVIDRVDDVRFTLTGTEFDTSAGRDTRSWWNGWVIKKKEKAHTSPRPPSPPPPYVNLTSEAL